MARGCRGIKTFRNLKVEPSQAGNNYSKNDSQESLSLALPHCRLARITRPIALNGSDSPVFVTMQNFLDSLQLTSRGRCVPVKI